MGDVIPDIVITPLRTIPTPGGDVWHAMKRTDPGFIEFGEAYFSTITYNATKPWKRHLRMTLNLIVPVGGIRFVLLDERPNSPSLGCVQSVILSRDRNYHRLTVPPGIWMAFQGLSEPLSVLLNIADMLHDPEEIERRSINYFKYDWNNTK